MMTKQVWDSTAYSKRQQINVLLWAIAFFPLAILYPFIVPPEGRWVTVPGSPDELTPEQQRDDLGRAWAVLAKQAADEEVTVHDKARAYQNIADLAEKNGFDLWAELDRVYGPVTIEADNVISLDAHRQSSL